eukprot:COSAG02_NODE_75_length_41389_cov_106.665762_44_plen_32_part_00
MVYLSQPIKIASEIQIFLYAIFSKMALLLPD